MTRLIKAHGQARVALYGFETDKSGLASVLDCDLRNWTYLQPEAYREHSRVTHTDAILLDESVLSSFLTNSLDNIPVLVLCNDITRSQIIRRQSGPSNLELIPKPFGIRKLSCTLLACLNKDYRFTELLYITT